MTAMWHVDGLKVSHKDPEEINKFIEFLKEKCEDDAGKVKVTREKAHKHLGMMLDYTVPGSARINMKECIDEDGEYRMSELDSRRSEVLRSYLEGVKVLR